MMAAKNLRIPDYLRHILQAIAQIETYAAGVEQTAFFENKLLQDGIIRNIEIIGEAANNILRLDSEFGKKYPTMALKAAYAMRNSLAHGYFLVDPILVWGTIQTDIPILKKQVMSALDDFMPPKTEDSCASEKTCRDLDAAKSVLDPSVGSC